MGKLWEKNTIFPIFPLIFASVCTLFWYFVVGLIIRNVFIECVDHSQLLDVACSTGRCKGASTRVRLIRHPTPSS